MTQLIDDFHAKSKQRAEELAKRLGVNFTPLDVDNVETKALRKMAAIKNYKERQEEFDALMEHVLTVLTPDEVLETLKEIQK